MNRIFMVLFLLLPNMALASCYEADHKAWCQKPLMAIYESDRDIHSLCTINCENLCQDSGAEVCTNQCVQLTTGYVQGVDAWRSTWRNIGTIMANRH